MTSLQNVEKIVTITPSEFYGDIDDKIYNKLIETYINTIDPNLGKIKKINKICNITQKPIISGLGNANFLVSFEAEVIYPKKDSVIQGIVRICNDIQVEVKHEDVIIFIPGIYMDGFIWNGKGYESKTKGKSEVITTGSIVEAKIIESKFEKLRFTSICRLNKCVS